MSNTLRRAAMFLLFLAAVSGWAVAGNALVSLSKPAASTDGQALYPVVTSVIEGSLAAEASGVSADYEPVKTHVTGQALAAISGIQSAKAAPLSGLAKSGAIKLLTLWRQGDLAMVEATYHVAYGGRIVPVGEHFLLTVVDNTWKVSIIWRMCIDQGGPILALDANGAAQLTCVSPSAASPASAPAASASPAASTAP